MDSLGQWVTAHNTVTPLTPVLGSEILIAELARAGIELLFMYPGTSELSICDAATRDARIRALNARGDAEAVFMASGANVWADTRAAAVIHGARGLTNSLGAIADVRRNEIPVLCIIGLPSNDSQQYLPPHGEQSLIANAGAFALEWYDCTGLSNPRREYIPIVRKAIDSSIRSPSGPVLLGIPEDLLTQPIEGASAEISPSEEQETTPQQLAEAESSLSSADRPVIFVDDFFLRRAQSQAVLDSIASQLQAPIFQVAYRRGPMLFSRISKGQVRNFMGLYDPDDDSHRYILNSADLIVTLEDRNMYPRVVGPLPTCPKLGFSSNARITSKNNYTRDRDMLVQVNDPLAALKSLRIEPSSAREAWWLVGAARDASGSKTHAQLDLETAPAPSQLLVQTISESLKKYQGTILVDDSQMLGGLISRYFECLPAELRVWGDHGGFVGGGIATAIGMAHKPGNKIVCLIGDHGLLNGIKALGAIGDIAASLVVICSNNGCSVSLSKQAKALHYQDLLDSGILRNYKFVDYCTLARGYGLEAFRIDWTYRDASDLRVSSGQLDTVMSSALESRVPTLIELLTPAEETFWTDVWRTSGYEE